jgi:flagellar hook assembly protein FlgD
VAPPVETVPVAVRQPVARSTSVQNFSISNSTIKFYCAETSPVTLSIYTLNGHCVGKLIDQTLSQGSHAIRWNGRNGDGAGVAPGLYTVRLKIKDREYYGQLNNIR